MGVTCLNMSSVVTLVVEIDETKRQSFVEIHRSTHEKLGYLKQALSVATLEWKQHSGTIVENHKVYVGIRKCFETGSRDVLKIGPHYAACLGLRQNQRVSLSPIRDYPDEYKNTSYLELRPADASDWEVAELQAHVIQEKLLSQIQVLTVNTKFPIWVFEYGQPIFFTVAVIPNADIQPSSIPPFVILEDGTELNVAALTRNRKAPPNALKSASNSSLLPQLTVWSLQKIRSPLNRVSNCIPNCPCNLEESGFACDRLSKIANGKPFNWECLVHPDDLPHLKPKKGLLWLRTVPGEGAPCCLISVSACENVPRGSICLPNRLLSIYNLHIASDVYLETPKISLNPPVCVVTVLEHVSNNSIMHCPLYSPESLAGPRKLPKRIFESLNSALMRQDLTAIWDGAVLPLEPFGAIEASSGSLCVSSGHASESPSPVLIPSSSRFDLINKVKAANNRKNQPSLAQNLNLSHVNSPTKEDNKPVLQHSPSSISKVSDNLSCVCQSCHRIHSYPFAVFSFTTLNHIPLPPPPPHPSLQRDGSYLSPSLRDANNTPDHRHLDRTRLAAKIPSSAVSSVDEDEDEDEGGFPWPPNCFQSNPLDKLLLWQGWSIGKSTSLPMTLRDAIVRASIGALAERQSSKDAKQVSSCISELENVIHSPPQQYPTTGVSKNTDSVPYFFTHGSCTNFIVSPVVIPLNFSPMTLGVSTSAHSVSNHHQHIAQNSTSFSFLSSLPLLLTPSSILPQPIASLCEVQSNIPSRALAFLRSCLGITAQNGGENGITDANMQFHAADVPNDASEEPVSLQLTCQKAVSNICDVFFVGVRDDAVSREVSRLLRTPTVSILSSPITMTGNGPSYASKKILRTSETLSAFLECLPRIRTFLAISSSLKNPSRQLQRPNGPPRLLIAGSRGSGKSTLIHALLEEALALHDTVSVCISCSALSTALSGDGGVRTSGGVFAVEMIVRSVFLFAEARPGCVVVLEDLDRLLSSPKNDSSSSAAQNEVLTVGTVLSLLERGLSSLSNLGAVVASVQSVEALHPRLRTARTFAQVSTSITNLTFDDRFKVLKSLLIDDNSTNGDDFGSPLNTSDWEDSLRSMARDTEGFLLSDLQGAYRRGLVASHHSPLVLSDQSKDSKFVEPKSLKHPHSILLDCVAAAISTYIPTALQAAGVAINSNDKSRHLSWTSVGGSTRVKKGLQNLLELPKKFSLLCSMAGISCPQGGILIGPPGSGKSLLARVSVAESGMRLFIVKGPELLSKYIGGSEAAVRDIFQRAAKAAPSVILFDEIESLAPRRGADSTGVTDRVVNQLLTFLDGVEGRDGVVVLGATSRPDLVDPALLRPGRLESMMFCAYPTSVEEIEDILKVSFGNVHVDEIVNLHSVALEISRKAFAAEGMPNPLGGLLSQADVASISSNAHIAAVHRLIETQQTEKLIITEADIFKAVEEVKPALDGGSLMRYLQIYKPLLGKEDADTVDKMIELLGKFKSVKERKQQRVALA
eukprot:GDKJ01003996.1.p1 GENE.GDKJ01003996.1~~GDKJ01003996.1.p1  ORF type:complete len:1491 (+),score=324.57 GDKJ01003996.1:1-4473(+)